MRVEAGGRIEFVHPLFASAVYSAASGGAGAARHIALSPTLAHDPEERARHLALAAVRAGRRGGAGAPGCRAPRAHARRPGLPPPS